MKLSELLADLHDAQDEYGDIEVMLLCNDADQLCESSQVRSIRVDLDDNEEIDLDDSDGEMCVEISAH